MDTYPPLPVLLSECVELTDCGVDQISLVNVSTVYSKRVTISPSLKGPPVYVFVGSTNYAAMNSQVYINTIGEADDQALICRTDNAQCCRGSDGLAAGEWRFPSGEVVPRRALVNASVPFVSSRDTGILRLHRRGSLCQVPLGPTAV